MFKQIRKWIIPGLLVISIFLAITFANAEDNIWQGSIQIAPLNPAFINYLHHNFPAQSLSGMSENQTGVANTKHSFGLIPLTIDYSHLSKYPALTQSASLLSIPTSFDLRNTNKVSPIKDQGVYGTCWAHATYGSLESDLLVAGETPVHDFSEKSLVNSVGWDRGYNDGGNSAMSLAYLTRWDGPVNESDDPYPSNASWQTSPMGLTVQKHVQNAIRFADHNETAVKNSLMTYGALYTSMYYNESTDPIYNSTTYGYYDYHTDDSYNHGTNHAVTIVGWNDNYSKNNFLVTPSRNGAWIVKNSWGTSWGESGYFYVSYDDLNFLIENVAFYNAEPVDNYNHIYQYDPLGDTGDLGYQNTTAWMSNIFTAAGDDLLAATGFYAEANNTSYQIKIYTNVSSSPTSGTLVATKTGTFTYAGYYTVLLTPIQLKAQQKFSIVVKITTPGYNWPLPTELKWVGITTNASNLPGQSYISPNGTNWADLTTLTTWDDPGNVYVSQSNFCLKAYTIEKLAITSQPAASQTVLVGDTVTLSVTTTGNPTPTYQWQFNGANIPSATSNNLILNNVTNNNNGTYKVVVNNKYGSVSATSVLTVLAPPVSMPIFTPDGGTFAAPWKVKIDCGEPGETVRYTTNGVDPTASSPVIPTGGIITVDKTMTVKAQAFKTGSYPSPIKTSVFTITGTVATPTFNGPKPGLYTAPPNVTISCSNPTDATIRYTMDGTEPTANSPIYNGPNIPLTTNSVTTIKAKAWKEGWDLSATATATYTITGKVTTPILKLTAGSYPAGTKVPVTYDDGTVARYTTNGSDPTVASSIVPDGGIVINNDMKPLKVKAFKSNWLTSDPTSATYTINQVAVPTFSLSAGTYYTPQTVTISCATIGATIYYSINGDLPTTPYKAGTKISLAKNTTTVINAIAKMISTGIPDSGISNATYIITDTALTPSFTAKSYSGSQSITINNPNKTGSIFYTTDGSEPDENTSKKYTTPFTLDYTMVSGPSTIKAKAFVSSFGSSAVATATYTPTVPAPVFSVPADKYDSNQTVKISCPLSGVTIRYTTNGVTPTAASPVVPESGIVVDHDLKIMATAFRPNWIAGSASATYTITKVADPVFSLAQGTYYSPQTVTISCTTPGATIYYYKATGIITDYTNLPSPLLYKAGTKISLSETSTVVAMAMLVDKNNNPLKDKSNRIPAIYKITGTVATPTFSPGSTTLKAGVSQDVNLKCTTQGASIFYTTDGSTPTPTNCLPYTGSISVNGSTTIKAFATMDDWVSSAVTTAVYTGTLAKPDLSEQSADITTEYYIAATCTDQDVVLRYTTNGKNPTASSSVVPVGGVLVNRKMTIIAQAFKTGWVSSAVVSKSYDFTGVATPTFSITDQTIIKAATAITISCATPGAEIHYAINGNLGDPITKANPKYTGPITLGGSAIIRAKAWVKDAESNNVGTIQIYFTGTVTTPVLSVSAGSYSVPQTVTINCDTAEAIYYTTNGTEPSMANGTRIVSGNSLVIDATTTLKVKAFKTDWTPSATVSAIYTIFQVDQPTFSPGDGSIFNPGQPIALSCSTTGATIHYTTNGNDPTLSDSAVTPGAKINIGLGSVTVKARAWKTGLNPSNIATATYTVNGLGNDESINAIFKSVSSTNIITNYLQEKFYHFLFFGQFALGLGAMNDSIDYQWTGPDTDGWYTATYNKQTFKIKSPNSNEVYLKMTYTDTFIANDGTSVSLMGSGDLSAKKGADGLWDGNLNVNTDSYDSLDTSSQSAGIKYHMNLAVTYANVVSDRGDGTYQVTGTFTAPGKPAYKIAGSYVFTDNDGLDAFYVIGSQTFNGSTKTVDEMYDISGKDKSQTINDYLTSVKAYNLIPSYLGDKFGNFLKTMNTGDFISSANYSPNTGTDADFQWSGPDSDGWYTANNNSTLLKFKSPNANTIWFRAISTGVKSGTADLIVTRGSNNRWSGTYNASFDNPVDPTGDSNVVYHVNLAEKFTDADLKTGDGSYDIALTCQVPGESCYHLDASYGFDANTGQFTINGVETLGACVITSLTSDQVNSRLGSIEMFSLVQNCVSAKFQNYLTEGEFSLNQYNSSSMSSFQWSAPDSTGWYTAKSGNMTFKFRSPNPDEIYLNVTQLKNTFTFTAQKGSNNLWNGTFNKTFDSTVVDSSQKSINCHTIFSEGFSDTDLSTGAGTYSNVSATFTVSGLSNHTLVANYVYVYNADSTISVAGSETFDGNTKTINEIYTKL